MDWFGWKHACITLPLDEIRHFLGRLKHPFPKDILKPHRFCYNGWKSILEDYIFVCSQIKYSSPDFGWNIHCADLDVNLLWIYQGNSATIPRMWWKYLFITVSCYGQCSVFSQYQPLKHHLPRYAEQMHMILAQNIPCHYTLINSHLYLYPSYISLLYSSYASFSKADSGLALNILM